MERAGERIPMRDLIILSAGRHGEEIAEIVKRINRVKKTWRLLGFLALDEKWVGQNRNGYRVLGTAGQLSKFPKAFLVPDHKWTFLSELPRRRLTSLIDPSSFVSPSARLGLGCVIYPHCFIGDKAKISDFVFCLSHCTINHDVQLGDRVILASGVSLAGYVRVEPGCYLGQASSCREKITIGQGSLVGMGSVVVKDVPAHTVVAGNPSKKLKQRF